MNENEGKTIHIRKKTKTVEMLIVSINRIECKCRKRKENQQNINNIQNKIKIDQRLIRIAIMADKETSRYIRAS